MLRKEPEQQVNFTDKRQGKTAYKGKKNYQTDYEGAAMMDDDEEMLDEGG